MAISSGAFEDCTTVKTVTFPNRDNSIYVYGKAFMGCTSLETVVIPAVVKIIWSKNVFKGCTALSAESKRAIIASGYKGGKDKSKTKKAP